MSGHCDEALRKLREGAKNVSGQKETAMAGAVQAALENFCRQEEEFAQAVVQGGGFDDCMRAVARGVGQSISDLEAYRKAVQFYFPGAEIRMQMTVDLIGAAAEETDSLLPSAASPGEGGRGSIALDFTSFL